MIWKRIAAGFAGFLTGAVLSLGLDVALHASGVMPLALVVTALPCCWTGGWLHARKLHA